MLKMNENLTNFHQTLIFHNKTPSLAVFASKFVFTKKQSIVVWIFYDRFGASETTNLGRHFYNEQLVVKLLSGTAKCHRCEILHRPLEQSVSIAKSTSGNRLDFFSDNRCKHSFSKWQLVQFEIKFVICHFLTVFVCIFTYVSCLDYFFLLSTTPSLDVKTLRDF